MLRHGAQTLTRNPPIHALDGQITARSTSQRAMPHARRLSVPSGSQYQLAGTRMPFGLLLDVTIQFGLFYHDHDTKRHSQKACLRI